MLHRLKYTREWEEKLASLRKERDQHGSFDMNDPSQSLAAVGIILLPWAVAVALALRITKVSAELFGRVREFGKVPARADAEREPDRPATGQEQR